MHPGSSHDAAIWATCSERRLMEQNYNHGERNTFLLGDSGYPLENWLVTPFKNSTNDQKRFNSIHASVRNPIERCNGVLKGTFRCLLGERVLRYQPKKVIQIINVCCALHNMRIQDKMDIMEYAVEINETDNPIIEEEFSESSSIQIRQNIFNSL